LITEAKLEEIMQKIGIIGIGVLVVLGMLTGFSEPTLAAYKTYHFGVVAGGMDLSQRSYITFESEADVETIHGTSSELKGMVRADLKGEKAQVKLEVPVASLNTGIDLRDQHLKSAMWLNAEKYPNITFASKSIKKAGKNEWKIQGTFTMHGVTRNLDVKADVREISRKLAERSGLGKGEWVKVSVPFKVKLSEFGVQVPKKLAARVNDTWDVRLVAFASTEAGKKGVAAMNPCNPCGGKKTMKAMNPCNPCDGKKASKAMNPCNPCGGKTATKAMNPCNPCG
jgi:polyisoprenoid-binding protein YceI